MANKLHSATDQRKFTIVYNDFLESDLLKAKEKMVFIAIKKFANNETHTAFPSIKKIGRITGMSTSSVQRSLKRLEELGVLTHLRRKDDVNGFTSNLYTIYDYAEIWKVKNEGRDTEDVQVIAEEISEAKMIATLRARGYTVSKEKEPVSELGGKDTDSDALHQYKIAETTLNYSGEKRDSQQERYSMEWIKDQFGMGYIEGASDPEDAAAVMNILYDALNYSGETLRVARQNKPTEVVISRLLKLSGDDILFVIEQFHKQKSKIKHPESYVLTQLYKAKEQSYLSTMNEGHSNGDF